MPQFRVIRETKSAAGLEGPRVSMVEEADDIHEVIDKYFPVHSYGKLILQTYAVCEIYPPSVPEMDTWTIHLL